MKVELEYLPEINVIIRISVIWGYMIGRLRDM